MTWQRPSRSKRARKNGYFADLTLVFGGGGRGLRLCPKLQAAGGLRDTWHVSHCSHSGRKLLSDSLLIDLSGTERDLPTTQHRGAFHSPLNLPTSGQGCATGVGRTGRSGGRGAGGHQIPCVSSSGAASRFDGRSSSLGSLGIYKAGKLIGRWRAGSAWVHQSPCS